MLLDSLNNGHLFPMEDPGGQSGHHISLFKDLREVFNLSGTGGSSDWDGNAFAYMLHQFNVKTTVGTVLVNTIE
jgi:hypothetical protein